jgi:hypothetical protein
MRHSKALRLISPADLQALRADILGIQQSIRDLHQESARQSDNINKLCSELAQQFNKLRSELAQQFNELHRKLAQQSDNINELRSELAKQSGKHAGDMNELRGELVQQSGKHADDMNELCREIETLCHNDWETAQTQTVEDEKPPQSPGTNTRWVCRPLNSSPGLTLIFPPSVLLRDAPLTCTTHSHHSRSRCCSCTMPSIHVCQTESSLPHIQNPSPSVAESRRTQKMSFITWHFEGYRRRTVRYTSTH